MPREIAATSELLQLCRKAPWRDHIGRSGEGKEKAGVPRMLNMLEHPKPLVAYA